MPKFSTLLLVGGIFAVVAVPPVIADIVNPSGAGEEGFYVARIVTTAPLRVCDLDEYAHFRDGTPGECYSGELFDTNRSPSLTPQELVDKNCAGARVYSYDVLQWKVASSPAKAIIRFTIPQGGCTNSGSAR